MGVQIPPAPPPTTLTEKLMKTPPEDSRKTLPPMAVLSCDCEHAFQDARYGLRMRQHTTGPSSSKEPFRCTVCGKGKHALRGG